MISCWLLVRRSLWHHRRLHLAVALGVAAATAVLTGALLVGDSVRGSLRALTLDRLGKIDAVLAGDRFFRTALATELANHAEFKRAGRIVTGAILLPQTTIERRSQPHPTRAADVLVIGCEPGFWELDSAGISPTVEPRDGEVLLNQALADELGAAVGDEVTLRLPGTDQVPADSPLANKNNRVRSLPNLRVIGIVPTAGLGAFRMQASQSLPWNAFVSPATVQRVLDQPDRVNAILVGTDSSAGGTQAGRPDEVAAWSRLLQPTVADFGLRLKRVTLKQDRGTDPQTVAEYWTVTTDRMVFAPAVADKVAAAVDKFGGVPVLTYLANQIEGVRPEIRPESAPQDGPAASRGAKIPYSMVTAIDVGDTFPLRDAAGQSIPRLDDEGAVLNSWAADRLQAKVGDRIRVFYFQPETTHGAAVESQAEFTIRGIVPLAKPAQPFRRNRPAIYEVPPFLANDPDLTPEVKGVTDQDTIDDWDAPFPFDYSRVLPEDEAYWESYRTTPKVFVSSAAGRRLWGSRFGQVTSFRVPLREGISEAGLASALEETLRQAAAELGFQFLPIRERQLAASRGTTPFDVLFLSLSFFVIAAALLLVALLFQLGIEQRATELGTLLALGYRRERVGWLCLSEGAVVAGFGAVLGVLCGLVYARLMLAGLSTWWLGAISVPFLQFHVTVPSLLLGGILGVGCAVMTIYWTVRGLRRVPARRLLAGQASSTVVGGKLAEGVSGQRLGWVRGLTLVAAIGLAALATQLGGMAQAGAFVGGGAALLTWLLLEFRRRLHGVGRSDRLAWERAWLLLGLAERNASRQAARSVITVSLMATATFLIVAMSSFRLAPTAAGVGGFVLSGTSSQPIFEDLNQPQNRNALLGSQAAALRDCQIVGLRLRGGDDASCQNLYQAAQPRVLGVTPQFIEHFQRPDAVSFTWAAAVQREGNPWQMLAGDATPTTDAVPVVLDKNTALYSLHLYRGLGEEFDFQYDDRPVRFRVVGLLENSILQGSLLIAESDFRQRFPEVSGFRYFLIAAPEASVESVAAVLEERFGDQGLDVVRTSEVLAQLLAVQNTYLSTFQSLGALGLLLGAFGLATVQLRNVLERRGELALLRAVGYRRRRLADLVMLESAVLLVCGLALGCLAALLAVLPHKLLGEAAFSWLLLRDLAIMLGLVLLAGLASSLVAVRAVVRLPLLASLRGE